MHVYIVFAHPTKRSFTGDVLGGGESMRQKNLPRAYQLRKELC